MQENPKKGSGCTKWAIGCSLALFLFVFAVGVGGYFAIRGIMSAGSGIKQFSEIFDMDDEIVNQSPYVPPEDGLLSLEQVETLVYIESEISGAIGTDYEKMMKEYSELSREINELKDITKLPELFSLSRKLLGPLHRAKKAQIDAINRKGISQQEYEWLKKQAMAVFDIPIVQFNLKNLWEDAQGETDSEAVDTAPPIVNPQNRELLEKHSPLLRKTLPLSAFGL